MIDPPAGHTELKLRICLGTDVAMGPGKADLLDALVRTGSISAAARHMGMSYRRAWLLIDTMNRCFQVPVVAAKTGGKDGGGAILTDFGRVMLADYRAMIVQAQAVITASAEHFFAHLATSGEPSAT
ncbi:MAG: winged helix-turn-helix domain-containing protein [Candidatus Sericytochromatia bacterium]|nr:winged helix-turn-helix domain-containing protein [Candidatus Sericytochromatia bacterium]